MLLIERMSVGRLFHAARSATLSARSPNLTAVLGSFLPTDYRVECPLFVSHIYVVL